MCGAVASADAHPFAHARLFLGGFSEVHPIVDTGKLSLAHATLWAIGSKIYSETIAETDTMRVGR